MSAKPIKLCPAILVGAFVAVASLGQAVSAASLPLVLLFPSPSPSTADIQALTAFRARLRADGRVHLLTFDPNAPALILAAAQAKHPEWLTAPVSGAAERLQIAQAIGAKFAAVVSAAKSGRINVRLLDSGPSLRTWNYQSFPTHDAVTAVENDILLPPPVAVPPAASATPPHAPAEVPLPQVRVNLNTPPAALPPMALPVPAQPAVTPPAAPQPASSASPGALAAEPLIMQANQDVAQGDVVDAYVLYQRAINDDPLNPVPRLKLAQAYLLGGEPKMALSEARRGLEVIPNSTAIQEFLDKYDTASDTTAGQVARYQALALNNPQDPSAHLDLGDALWSEGKNADAEQQYHLARTLSSDGSLTQEITIAHLARLHAAAGDYTLALQDIKASKDLAYPLVLSVVENKADNLITDMNQAQSSFTSGDITRAALYGTVQKAEKTAQDLASFVGKITPPAAYLRSHLDRVQAMNLLSQASAVLASYLETNDLASQQKYVELEKDAQAEMLTAYAAEEKLGLWNTETRLEEGNN